MASISNMTVTITAKFSLVLRMWLAFFKGLAEMLRGAEMVDALIIVGFAFCWSGARAFHPGAGVLLVGLLIVFYIKPLKRWWS